MAYAPLSIASSHLAVVANAVLAPSLIQVATLAGALDLSSAANEGKHAMILALDCGGAGRAVTLPTGADAYGLIVFILNKSDAAESLTVNTDVAVINQNEGALFYNIAGTWTLISGFSIVVDMSA